MWHLSDELSADIGIDAIVDDQREHYRVSLITEKSFIM